MYHYKSPGVYVLFLDAREGIRHLDESSGYTSMDDVLYIGKAKSQALALKMSPEQSCDFGIIETLTGKKVADENEVIATSWMNKCAHFKFISTKSEQEAIELEKNLILQYKPLLNNV